MGFLFLQTELAVSLIFIYGPTAGNSGGWFTAHPGKFVDKAKYGDDEDYAVLFDRENLRGLICASECQKLEDCYGFNFNHKRLFQKGRCIAMQNPELDEDSVVELKTDKEGSWFYEKGRSQLHGCFDQKSVASFRFRTSASSVSHPCLYRRLDFFQSFDS